jgi:hypothetical protein
LQIGLRARIDNDIAHAIEIGEGVVGHAHSTGSIIARDGVTR